MLLLLPVLLSYYAIGLKDHMLPESIQNVESTLGSPMGTQDNVKLMELSVSGSNVMLTDNTHAGNLSHTHKHTSLQHQHVNKHTDGEVLTLTLLQT